MEYTTNYKLVVENNLNIIDLIKSIQFDTDIILIKVLDNLTNQLLLKAIVQNNKLIGIIVIDTENVSVDSTEEYRIVESTACVCCCCGESGENYQTIRCGCIGVDTVEATIYTEVPIGETEYKYTIDKNITQIRLEYTYL